MGKGKMSEESDGPRIQEIDLDGMTVVVLSLPLEPSLPDVLTEAELQVAKLALRGLSNEQIASERGSALQTVANQLRTVFEKCAVNSRGELAALAYGAPSPGGETTQ